MQDKRERKRQRKIGIQIRVEVGAEHLGGGIAEIAGRVTGTKTDGTEATTITVNTILHITINARDMAM